MDDLKSKLSMSSVPVSRDINGEEVFKFCTATVHIRCSLMGRNGRRLNVSLVLPSIPKSGSLYQLPY